MEQKNILTALRKYRFIVLIISVLLVTGCSGDYTDIDASTPGFFNEYMVYPFSLLIKWIAEELSGSYGLSIIVITIALRLVILPFMVKQQKQGQETQEMMKIIKPEMDAIQEKYKDKQDSDKQLKMQKELSELYKKYNVNPIKSMAGCFPMLIQMPFLIGFYYAIRRTPEIAEHSFLWFNLGEVNILIALIAVLTYYLQGRVGLIGSNQTNKGPMSLMLYVSPIMIGMMSFVMPAALPLYWTIGGLFMIVQTVITKKYILTT
ncbi:membrane protein insertase YidC [Gracilibacillus salinarum]|uniref:Membrane protein insertase YidC n=1 Tax=Gracilibacillus salinarum TaxID=2932255 RepID=A0ABY4GH34_9BACI|nr:membrane protein insertase YidC [Gracilibacillus salinarum]UOQ83520.1 membrane protein insertase YidC [Gracilibacillus salinarum]